MKKEYLQVIQRLNQSLVQGLKPATQDELLRLAKKLNESTITEEELEAFAAMVDRDKNHKDHQAH
jgi:hypothetical protein